MPWEVHRLCVRSHLGNLKRRHMVDTNDPFIVEKGLFPRVIHFNRKQVG